MSIYTLNGQVWHERGVRGMHEYTLNGQVWHECGVRGMHEYTLNGQVWHECGVRGMSIRGVDRCGMSVHGWSEN